MEISRRTPPSVRTDCRRAFLQVCFSCARLKSRDAMGDRSGTVFAAARDRRHLAPVGVHAPCQGGTQKKGFKASPWALQLGRTQPFRPVATPKDAGRRAEGGRPPGRDPVLADISGRAWWSSSREGRPTLVGAFVIGQGFLLQRSQNGHGGSCGSHRNTNGAGRGRPQHGNRGNPGACRPRQAGCTRRGLGQHVID